MSLKLLIVDCDGTIRETKSGKKFISIPEDQKKIEGASEKIDKHVAEGWLIYGLSNQGGVAAGYKSLESAIEEQQYTLKLFPQVEAIFFCPDYEGQNLYKCEKNTYLHYDRAYPQRYPAQMTGYKFDSFRKPGTGGIDFVIAYAELITKKRSSEVLLVGDRTEDFEAASAAQIDFQWSKFWREELIKL